MLIYKATNKINGKSYIGQTVKTLEKRKKEHQRSLIRYYFQGALHKYGFNNFKWDILYKCNKLEELDEKEKYYIKKYDTFNNGYNLTLGGNSHCGDDRKKGEKISESKKGHIVSDETKKKISETLKSKGYIKGQFEKGNAYGIKKHSDETKNKLSIIKKDYYKNNPMTKETIEKIKKTSKERGVYEKIRKLQTGRKLSDETKKKISEKGKGSKKKYPKNRKSREFNKETNKKISNSLKKSHKDKGHTPIYLICKTCGEKYKVPYSQRYRKFCSRNCYYEFKKKNNQSR